MKRIGSKILAMLSEQTPVNLTSSGSQRVPSGLRVFTSAVCIGTGVLFAAAPASALDAPVEAAKGYEIDEFCPGYADIPLPSPVNGPTSVAMGRHGKLYVTFLSGHILEVSPPHRSASKQGCSTRLLTILTPPNAYTPIGIGVHPRTGEIYVAHGYLAGPDPANVDDVKARISILDPHTGALTTFVDNQNSMLFDALPVPIVGTQGFDWDGQGNIYWAQGINTESAWRWENCQNAGVDNDGLANTRCDNYSHTDEWQSAIMMADKHGNPSVFSPGHRSPYDVAVGNEKRGGRALYLYAGDNGEGEECLGTEAGGVDPADEIACAEYTGDLVNSATTTKDSNDDPSDGDDTGSRLGDVIREESLGYVNSLQYWDELNRVWPGKHYGWPGGFSGEPGETHIGPLWNLDKINRRDDGGPLDWWVPTGIESIHGRWGKVEKPVLLGSWGTRSGSESDFEDVGAVEMFWGHDLQNRLTLVKKINGVTDVHMGKGGKLYVIEWTTSRIYRVWPAKHHGHR